MTATGAGLSEDREHAPISLRRNFAWTLAGNVLYAGSQWGMLVALTKLGSPKIVGQFALGLAIAAPVMMFSNLSLRAVFVTAAQGRAATCIGFASYLGLRLATTAGALLTITAIAFGTRVGLETALVIVAVGLAKSFESISDMLYAVLQRRERLDWIAKSMMLKGPLSLAALGLSLYLSESLLCGVLALGLVWSLLLIGYDLPRCTELLGSFDSSSLATRRPRWRAADLAPLARVALPLAFVQMLISLSGNFPRYFVERKWGVRDLGIFAALAYIPAAGNAVINALAGSALPKLARYYALENMRAFRRLVSQLLTVGALLGALGVLTVALRGRQILTILYRPEYAQHPEVFLWIMIAAGLGYVGTFLGTVVTATGAFASFVIPYCLYAAVAAIACWVLIPAFGLLGAAWAMCAASLASCLVPIIIFARVRILKAYEPLA
jgi:O-antigen/teichoic acid export membrane protein